MATLRQRRQRAAAGAARLRKRTARPPRTRYTIKPRKGNSHA